ncbi:50S ribosomal protein L30 [Eisenibacter elegans]|jgi:large subunit ribosomal protein L30|uniref:50S ribosomal protein L30 n=1 Tax=Eisenibacter elegans TaxID=997 RepID=UPI00040A63FD|nr:50S ribosomal protein L30 [Eisenibacter elegans]
MAKVKITQVRSVIKRTQRQKDTIQALGLGKIGRSKEHEFTPVIAGMIEKVQHLVRVEQL